jgi:hypothetical protein
VVGLDISYNQLTTKYSNAFASILLMGGLTLDERQTQYTAPARQNTLEKVSITCNQMNGADSSIEAIGGRGMQADDNHIIGLFLSDNQVDTRPVVTIDDQNATGNTVEVSQKSP